MQSKTVKELSTLMRERGPFCWQQIVAHRQSFSGTTAARLAVFMQPFARATCIRCRAIDPASLC
jgi:hypothetical protein